MPTQHAVAGDGALHAARQMRVAGYRPCVMSYTAALKAPCTCGDIVAARQLLREMEADFGAAANETATPAAAPLSKKQKKKKARAAADEERDAAGSSSSNNTDWIPNVRTANTFVRGCLVSGAVDDAVALLARLGSDGVWSSVEPDASTLEYVGTLCAQALRLDEATRLAERLADLKGVGGSAHAAARVRVAACRGALLCGKLKRCVSEASAARALLKSDNGEEMAMGGDAEEGGGGGGAAGRALFRQHQKAEALGELKRLEKLANGSGSSGAGSSKVKSVMPLLLKRTLPLPSGDSNGGGDDIRSMAAGSVLQELSCGFGLDAWSQQLNERSDGTGDAKVKALRKRLKRVLSDGSIDLDTLFDVKGQGGGEAEEGDDEQPLSSASGCRLELGCGSGEWLAAQAEAAPDVRWIANELRRDRAHHTIARIALSRLRNAAVLACDATAALERWIPPGSLDAIYVNFPEPPQQAPTSASEGGGSGMVEHTSEGSHMCDERMLNAASVALSPGGTLTIVSDNAWYAELLFEMVNEHGDFEGAASKKDAEAEGLGGPVTIVRAAPMSKSNQVRGGKSVTLLSAKPGAWCRHASSSASSYFDRMWQTGLSKHSAKEARYVLHLRRR